MSAADLAQLTVYVKPELLRAIKAQADADGRSVSSFVARHLITHFGPRKRRGADAPHKDPTQPAA
jgi:hypothetical protein